MEELEQKIIELAKQKKYLEIIDGKAVYRWIEKLDLYSEIDESSPHDDKPLSKMENKWHKK